VVSRVGHASDAHTFGPELGLRLGGIEIAAAPRLRGHSDGDAALHAVAGALLGAAGLDDLGSLFPSDHRTPAGVSSADLLRDVTARVRAAGWQPTAIDLTIRAGRPPLGAHLPAMRAAIAAATGVSVAAVGIKASSANLSGDAGAGRSVEATALATLVELSGDR